MPNDTIFKISSAETDVYLILSLEVLAKVPKNIEKIIADAARSNNV